MSHRFFLDPLAYDFKRGLAVATRNLSRDSLLPLWQSLAAPAHRRSTLDLSELQRKRTRRPETFQQSVFANIQGDHSLIPVCNHFCRQTQIPAGSFYRSIADMDKQRMMERYMQSNICQSDILLDEVTLDEEEKTVMSLVLSLNSLVNRPVARQRLVELKSLHPTIFHRTRWKWREV